MLCCAVRLRYALAPLAGEYLCPICRRLGNCLLPLAAPPSSTLSQAQAAVPPSAGTAAAGAAEAEQAGAGVQQQQWQQQRLQHQEEYPTLSCQEALARLEHLLADEAGWVSTPATSNAQLVHQWRAAQEEAGGGAGVSGGDALRLLPLLGSHAAGVAALCEFARLAGTKWILQQQRLLDWLQSRGELTGGAPHTGAPQQGLVR